MTQPTTYTVQARYDGHWWVIDVVGLKGLHTQARLYSEIEATSTEAIALFEDIEPETFEIVIDALSPPSPQAHSAAR